MSEQTEVEVKYLCHRVKGLKVTISMGKRNVLRQAVNGILTVSLAESAALDAMMRRRSDLKQNLRKIDNSVDPVAVERQRQILMARQKKGPSAVKGAMHSGAASIEKMRQTDAESRLYTPPASDKLAGEYVEQSVTGQTDPSQHDPSRGDANALGMQNPANAAVPVAAPVAPKLNTDSLLGRIAKK